MMTVYTRCYEDSTGEEMLFKTSNATFQTIAFCDIICEVLLSARDDVLVLDRVSCILEFFG